MFVCYLLRPFILIAQQSGNSKVCQQNRKQEFPEWIIVPKRL